MATIDVAEVICSVVKFPDESFNVRWVVYNYKKRTSYAGFKEKLCKENGKTLWLLEFNFYPLKPRYATVKLHSFVSLTYPLYVKYTVSLSTEMGESIYAMPSRRRTFGQIGTHYGEFISDSDFDKNVIDDQLVITVDIVVSTEEIIKDLSLRFTNSSELSLIPSWRSVFLKMFEEQTFTDVELHGKDFAIRAHRIVLATGGSGFKTIFNHDKCSNATIINLGNICFNTLNEVLIFLYTGEDPYLRIWGEDVTMEIILFSKRYGIEKMVKFGLKQMLAFMSVRNVIKFLIFADDNRLEEFKEECIIYICNNKTLQLYYECYKALRSRPELYAYLRRKLDSTYLFALTYRYR